MNPINVTSEIGKLKTVMVHRPGKEIENLTPDTMERLLFDDIPYINNIEKEHDLFTDTLKSEAIEVLYLEDLAVESLVSEHVKGNFLAQMWNESGVVSAMEKAVLSEYFASLGNDEIIRKLMQGVRKEEVSMPANTAFDLADGNSNYPFLLDPMPNLYFTRDPFASIGNGVTINKMTFAARQRESLFCELIFNHHPRFAKEEMNIWLDRYSGSHIEGGDELVLSEKVVAIGISQRTCAESIKLLAKALFESDSGYEKVLAIKIPNNRAMMHLDTVFTMIDYDKFTIHPAIMDGQGKMDIYVLEKDASVEGVKSTLKTDLKAVLCEALEVSEIELLPTGHGDAVVAPREQWNDGSNTLAIAPGVVVTYDRNYVSNQMLREAGIRVLEIHSGELSRGRGGPRCMSQPIVRENLKK